ALTGKQGVLLETLIRADEISHRDAIEGHGLDYSVLMNAKPYQQVVAEMEEKIGLKQVLAWDLDELANTFEQCALENRARAPRFAGVSVMIEYSRFVGEIERANRYVRQPLPGEHSSCRAQCEAIYAAIQQMAASNQMLTDLAASPTGWTAEFYK